jgi:hypothetical protein
MARKGEHVEYEQIYFKYRTGCASGNKKLWIAAITDNCSGWAVNFSGCRLRRQCKMVKQINFNKVSDGYIF